MESLPDEILLRIFDYLGPKDVVSLQLVSRSITKRARDNALWRLHCFQSSYRQQKRENQRQRGDALRAETRYQAVLNWDPTYPHEKIDFRQEYIQRTAPIALNWFEPHCIHGVSQEITAANLLFSRGTQTAEKLIGTLEDGSICIWHAESTSSLAGRLVACRPRCLPPWTPSSNPIVEGASMDSFSDRAYFASSEAVREVDLETLKITAEFTSSRQICAISEAQPGHPVTVTTERTVELWDPRQPNCISCSKCILPEPGKRPISILHAPAYAGSPDSSSIWVAGRFSHLLNFDRRRFPLISQTLHSGSHTMSLSALPNAYFKPRKLILKADSPLLSVSEIAKTKETIGHTIMAAGNYRGLGSLELYGVTPGVFNRTHFKNRQTIAFSGALAVAPHAGKIVYSDASGHLKWLERDGFTPVRSININSVETRSAEDCAQAGSVIEQFADRAVQARAGWGGQDVAAGWGHQDVVKRILPTKPNATTDAGLAPGDDNLVVLTEDGRLGMVGFGSRQRWEWKEAGSAEQLAVDPEVRRAERDYEDNMRQLLLHHENELNYVRGFGLGNFL